MEAQGPEAKRPRLDTYNDGSHRGPQYTSIAPSHGHSPYSLPPRNHYPPSAPPPPPSPYYEAGIPDHSRALPDPTGYTHSQSGHNTPAREQRHYAPEATYSRRGSTSGTTRSPDSYQHYVARPLNSNAGTNDGHYPPATYATDSAGHAVGYPNHDGSMNGAPHHGLPMSAYPEHPPTLPPGRPEYSQSPVNATPHQYPGIPYGPQSNYQMMQRSRKGNRATQVCRPSSSTWTLSNKAVDRLAISADKGRRNVTKADRNVVSVLRITCLVITRTLRRRSIAPSPPVYSMR